MKKISSREQFFDLFTSKNHNFIEFYSPGCRYCGMFADDFNKVFRHMRDYFGKE